MTDYLTDADLDAIERDLLATPRLGRSMAREADRDMLAIRTLLAEVRCLRAAEAQVREVHKRQCLVRSGINMERLPQCAHCYVPWPCPTIIALGWGE